MNYHLPMTILGMTGIIGGLSVLLLPETANQGLTDTLDDIEEETRYAKLQPIPIRLIVLVIILSIRDKCYH